MSVLRAVDRPRRRAREIQSKFLELLEPSTLAVLASTAAFIAASRRDRIVQVLARTEPLSRVPANGRR